MNHQKKIKKGKFIFQETWVFPKPVSEFCQELFTRLGIEEKSLCHAFCGDSKLGGLRIDIDPLVKPDIVADCLDLPDILGFNSQKHVFADPPWKIPYGKRRYFSYAMRDILKPDGYLIINAPWSPWVTGLSKPEAPETEVWKVEQAFNSYRELVDFWIFKKL